jgi:hypothetical protein
MLACIMDTEGGRLRAGTKGGRTGKEHIGQLAKPSYSVLGREKGQTDSWLAVGKGLVQGSESKPGALSRS